MENIEVKHGVLYPCDEPGAIGLLFAEDEDGEEVTVVADPEWLRTLLKGIDAGADVGLLEIPVEVLLPVATPGWDDAWDDQQRLAIDNVHWMFRESGHDWPRVRGAIEVLTGSRP